VTGEGQAAHNQEIPYDSSHNCYEGPRQEGVLDKRVLQYVEH